MSATKRACGSCTACCKAPELITREYYKPPGKWCKHCNIGRGCKIYPERYEPCRDFECQWLLGFGAEEERPDRCHYMLDFRTTDPVDPKMPSFEDVVHIGTSLNIWEVSVGALESKGKRVMEITEETAEQGIIVFHIPLRGCARMFQVVQGVIKSENVIPHYFGDTYAKEKNVSQKG